VLVTRAKWKDILLGMQVPGPSDAAKAADQLLAEEEQAAAKAAAKKVKKQLQKAKKQQAPQHVSQQQTNQQHEEGSTRQQQHTEQQQKVTAQDVPDAGQQVSQALDALHVNPLFHQPANCQDPEALRHAADDTAATIQTTDLVPSVGSDGATGDDDEQEDPSVASQSSIATAKEDHHTDADFLQNLFRCPLSQVSSLFPVCFYCGVFQQSNLLSDTFSLIVAYVASALAACVAERVTYKESVRSTCTVL